MDSHGFILYDLENLMVTTHQRFHKVMDRSEKRYETEGGLTTDLVRESSSPGLARLTGAASPVREV